MKPTSLSVALALALALLPPLARAADGDIDPRHDQVKDLQAVGWILRTSSRS